MMMTRLLSRHGGGARSVKGMTIGAILLAVVLLAGIAVVIALGMRSADADGNAEKSRALASAILEQGAVIQRAVDQLNDQNVRTCWINVTGLTWPANKDYYLFDPALTMTPVQIPPAAALNDRTQKWQPKYGYCWGNIYEPGVGHPQYNYTHGNYGFILSDLTQGVCAQINSMLYNSTAITSSPESFATWTGVSQTTTVWPGNSNQPEACFETSDGKFIYYKTVDTRQPGEPMPGD